MPTYEYVCSACKNEWEVEQSMKDNALTECPRCKDQTARRQISRGTGFILKGGGWYSDLYAGPKPNGAKDQGSSKDSTSKEASTSSTSTNKSTKDSKKSEAAA
jgi:putative FmdB family regulatory protein